LNLYKRLVLAFVMRFWLSILFVALSIKGFSQEKAVAGIVCDKLTQNRIAKVIVQNTTTGQEVYNNLNGVFTIDAQPGDILIFSKQEYINDTVKVVSHIPIAVYMNKGAIQLREVTIRDTALSPEKKLAATKNEYNKAYGSLANRDLLNMSSGGVGLGIDALWNMISREGRNAAHLRATIDRDYKQDVIDYRFNKRLVGSTTGLKDGKLTDFMQKYRPGYFFVLNATDYEFIESIKNNYRRYLRNPKAYALAPLATQKQ
jgi:hypothetical protein